MTARNPVSGRFEKVDIERDVLAPGLGVPREYAYGLEQRHAPEADTLAGQPHPGLLSPRYARTVSGGSEREVYATPRRETLRNAVTTTETGRSWAQQEKYVVGDITESEPGDVAAAQRFGIQGRHVRAAARRSADPMDPSKYLSGADLDD